MTIESKPTVVRAATFGTLSVVVPFIGAFLFYVLIWVMSDFQYGFILGMAILPLTPICGGIFAVVAWIRHERHSALPWIGSLINLAIILYLVTQRNHIIGSFG